MIFWGCFFGYKHAVNAGTFRHKNIYYRELCQWSIVSLLVIKVEVRFLIPVLARRVEKLRFFGGVAITYEEDVTVLFSQQTNFKKPFCARRQEEEKEEKKNPTQETTVLFPSIRQSRSTFIGKSVLKTSQTSQYTCLYGILTSRYKNTTSAWRDVIFWILLLLLLCPLLCYNDKSAVAGPMTLRPSSTIHICKQ